MDKLGYGNDFTQYPLFSEKHNNILGLPSKTDVETIFNISLPDDYQYSISTDRGTATFNKLLPLLVYGQYISIFGIGRIIKNKDSLNLPGIEPVEQFTLGWAIMYRHFIRSSMTKQLLNLYNSEIGLANNQNSLLYITINSNDLIPDKVSDMFYSVPAFFILCYDDTKQGNYFVLSSMYATGDITDTSVSNGGSDWDLMNFMFKKINDVNLITMLNNAEYSETPPFVPSPSPYDPAGPSTSGGGDGSFDNKSDPVDFTELPSLSVVNSGFAGLFKPTLSQLNQLANYLWNEEINLDQLKKLVANPIDLLISLTIMPVDPPTAGSESIKVGFIDTGISINKIENQYMTIDFGSLEVKEYYGNALDYSPYTKISIYLPYIGLKQLNTDDVMKKALALRYNVDLFTGACVAEIKAGESVLYTFTGNIANQIPLNAESFNSFLSGLIQAAASVGVAIASHGTSVATQGAAEAGEATAMAARGAQTASNLASMNAALTSAGAVATSKPDILHSGSMTANNGYLSGKTPYLIYEVPRACIPENYQTFVGYPSNITKALSEVSGFTVVDSIHLENVPATDSELAEIERLLKGGIIL